MLQLLSESHKSLTQFFFFFSLFSLFCSNWINYIVLPSSDTILEGEGEASLLLSRGVSPGSLPRLRWGGACLYCSAGLGVWALHLASTDTILAGEVHGRTSLILSGWCLLEPRRGNEVVHTAWWWKSSCSLGPSLHHRRRAGVPLCSLARVGV